MVLTPWKMAARDVWIGWNAEQRGRQLQFIVNNSRFLVLPWVHIQGLASKILAQSARQLPTDWEHHYGYRPWLLETLVDPQRFRGTCYRAANWIRVGKAPDAAAWTGSTKLMAKQLKISTFIH